MSIGTVKIVAPQTATPGSTININVDVSAINHPSYPPPKFGAATIRLAWDPAVLSVLTVVPGPITPAQRGFFANLREPGKAQVAVYSTRTELFTSPGTLLKLTAEVVGVAGTKTDFGFFSINYISEKKPTLEPASISVLA